MKSASSTDRDALEKAVIRAALELFGATGSAAFKLPIPHTTPPLFVCVGDDLAIGNIGKPTVVNADKLLERTAQLLAHRVCCGTEHDPANGKLHGYCVVCGVVWPCEYAK